MSSNESPISSEETAESEDAPDGATDATLDDAARRLEQALESLEGLIEQKSAKISELGQALEAAQAENKDLRQRLEQASEKVDGVTKRLQETLEDKG
ncbi:hypothetical protein [Fodinicurvata fenggangensis]|uniref:hypothetical protein n=1 Tax=Fodinicurvata fenggangensis TaxID=1121830 RepID=UPI00047B5FCA|nr:hypothetical protein [Fodinicurvata fenggangensis]